MNDIFIICDDKYIDSEIDSITDEGFDYLLSSVDLIFEFCIFKGLDFISLDMESFLDKYQFDFIEFLCIKYGSLDMVLEPCYIKKKLVF